MRARVACLFIDDEPVAAQVYAKAIQNRGVEVIVAGSADEGLEYAERYQPRVIICDVQMPGMNGFQFAHELNTNGLRTGPLLFLTGQDDIRVLKSGLQIGGDDFIVKSNQPNVLLSRVIFWLGGGFQALPDIARQKAIQMLIDIEEGKQSPFSDQVRREANMLQLLAGQAQEEVLSVNPRYGERLAERIYFLGRFSHLVLGTCSNIGRVLRFPDYLLSACSHLQFPWLQDLAVLLAQFDKYSEDPRFREAAEGGLIEVAN